MADIVHHRAHVVAGGFPPGSSAGHDHDYARLRLLTLLAERQIPASVANDFADMEKWLVAVAEIREVGRVIPIFGARMVGQYPRATRVDALRDDGKAGFELSVF